MARPYLSYEDMRMRLHRTITMYNGEPFLTRVNEDKLENNIVYLYALDKANDRYVHKIKVEDPKFSVRAPELGYISFRNDAYYVMRKPERKQFQGLTSNSVCLLDGDDLRGVPINAWFLSTSMKDCILGRHHSLNDAIAKMHEDPDINGIPVHRHAALRYVNGNLLGIFYRGLLVATEAQSGRFAMLPTREASVVQRVLNRIGVRIQ